MDLNSVVLAVLVAQLGDYNFKSREVAELTLVKLDRRAHIHLLGGEKSKDPERRARCTRLLNQWYDRHAAALAADTLARFGSTPWVYPYDYDSVDLARRVRPNWFAAGPDWPLWREATRLYVADLHRGRTEESEIWRQLSEFAEEERKWKDTPR